jgi:hypothetical protein
MDEITATKKIINCGTSLSVNITKEAHAMDLKVKDYVIITIRKVNNKLDD